MRIAQIDNRVLIYPAHKEYRSSQIMNDISQTSRKHQVEDARNAFENMPKHMINVGETERWLSVAGGIGLVVYGLKTRGLSGLLMGGLGAGLLYRGTTGYCPAYDQLEMSTAENDRSHASLDGKHAVKVEESVFVAADQVTLYKFWRDLSNLPRLMSHLESVTELDSKRSRWVAKAPAGFKVEWEAEIISERENELISWRSLEGSEIPNAGSVWFTRDSSGAGTNVKVSLMYHPPAGKLGGYIAKLFGEEPSIQIKDDLNRFKMAAEAGRLNGALSL